MAKNLWIIGAVILVIIVGGAYFLMQQPKANNLTGTINNPSFSSKDLANQQINQQPAAANNPPATTSQEYHIVINNFAFSPATLTIKKGDKVTWTNEDTAPHTATSDTGTEIDSPKLSKGQTFTYLFDEAGTFPYHCKIHPSMKATIIVQ